MNDPGRLLLAFGALLLGSSPSAQQLDGEWVGGYQDGRSYVYLTPSFVTENGTTSGRTAIPLQRRRNVPLAELRFDGRELSFTLAERAGFRRIRAEVVGDVVSGTADLGGRSVPFHLVRVIPVSSERLASLGGLYQLADGTIVGFIGGDELGVGSFIDFGTGLFRSIFPLSDSEFAIGPGSNVPWPREKIVSFHESGGTREISIREGTREVRGRPLSTLRKEDVRFRNADVTLAGRLVLPPGEGPFPAVVFLHGSGPATRGGPFLLPDYFAHLGFATLSYDKRGCGESTGTYIRQVDAREFERLAWDALAGVDFLKTRAEIDPARIGLWGISQAGWIIALACASSEDIAFSVVVSGPAVTLGEEGYFSTLTGDDGDGPRLTEAEIAARMREYTPTGYDPRPFLEEIRSPSLWLFGNRDPSVPVARSVEVLQAVSSERDWDVTVRVLPNANHILLECETGDRGEFPLLRRFAPGYLELMTGWMRERARLANPPSTDDG